MLSVRPKIAELAFRVFSRGLHPELYSVLQSRRVDRSGYEARIDITNCGHVVTWNAGGVTLCEVATSASQPLPTRRCLLSLPLKGSRSDRTQHGGAVYRTSFQLESVAPEMFFMVGQTLSTESTMWNCMSSMDPRFQVKPKRHPILSARHFAFTMASRRPPRPSALVAANVFMEKSLKRHQLSGAVSRT